jgi:hypothetical protein
MYLQSIKSVKHNAAKAINRLNFKEKPTEGFGVFIVHLSTGIGYSRRGGSWGREFASTNESINFTNFGGGGGGGNNGKTNFKNRP